MPTTTRTESNGEQLVRMLQEMSGLHSITQAQVAALIPLAEELVKAEGRDPACQDLLREADALMGGGHRELNRENFLASIRALLNTANDAGAASAALTGERAITAQLEKKLIGARADRDALSAEVTRLRETLVENAPPKSAVVVTPLPFPTADLQALEGAIVSTAAPVDVQTVEIGKPPEANRPNPLDAGEGIAAAPPEKAGPTDPIAKDNPPAPRARRQR